MQCFLLLLVKCPCPLDDLLIKVIWLPVADPRLGLGDISHLNFIQNHKILLIPFVFGMLTLLFQRKSHLNVPTRSACGLPCFELPSFPFTVCCINFAECTALVSSAFASVTLEVAGNYYGIVKKT